MKTRKLFLNEPDETGFRGISFEPLEDEVLDSFMGDVAEQGTGVSEPEPMVQCEPASGAFRLGGDLWSLLDQDPSLRAEVDRVVEQRVAERLEPRYEALRTQIESEARAQGFSEGLAAATQERAAFVQTFTRISQQILDAKEQLLREHERAWCSALVTLVRRIPAAKGEELLRVVQRWIAEALPGASNGRRVRVLVSEADAVHLQEISELPGNYEIVKDLSLAAGEVRAECDGAGIFYSASEEYQRLERWLGEMFVEGGSRS